MALQVEIPDEAVKYLNEPARDELAACLKEHAEELLREASRLEANLRTTARGPEITSSMVRDASIQVNRHYINPRRPKWIAVVKVLAAVTSLVTGILIEKLAEPWGPPAFAVSVSIAAILTTITVAKE
jgi:hypothetical protein